MGGVFLAETDLDSFLVLILLAPVFAIVGSAIGTPRGNGMLGTLLGLFLGPVGWLIVAVIPRTLEAEAEFQRQLQAQIGGRMAMVSGPPTSQFEVRGLRMDGTSGGIVVPARDAAEAHKTVQALFLEIREIRMVTEIAATDGRTPVRPSETAEEIIGSEIVIRSEVKPEVTAGQTLICNLCGARLHPKADTRLRRGENARCPKCGALNRVG